jgi:DNA-binding response OmpR family regulator
LAGLGACETLGFPLSVGLAVRRVTLLARRAASMPRVAFGGLRLDPARRLVFGAGELVAVLAPNEVTMLASLIARRGRIVSDWELTRELGLDLASPQQRANALVPVVESLKRKLGHWAHIVRRTSRGYRVKLLGQR